jgi:hypothetical protein
MGKGTLTVSSQTDALPAIYRAYSTFGYAGANNVFIFRHVFASFSSCFGGASSLLG